MYYQLSTLALATLAAAAPTAPEAKSSTFRLVMPVNDVNMSLTAVQSKYKGALDIVALDAGTTGTPGTKRMGVEIVFDKRHIR